MWAMRATEQDCSKIGRLMAAGFRGGSALPIWTARYPDDNRPALAIQAARDYASGLISREVLVAAWDAAWDAAEAAAWDAAWDAAGDAARDAAGARKTGRNLCVVPPAGKRNRMMRPLIDPTEDYAQGHEQPWASIRLRDPLRVGWATVAGWIVIVACAAAALAWAGCFDR